MKTTDMFLSEEERNFGVKNTPIVLCIQKMPQGQVFSPHVISLRGSTGARKLESIKAKTVISQVTRKEIIKTPQSANENLFVEPEEDEILSSIENLFRGKNARVQFNAINKNSTVEKSERFENNSIYKIPSQQEQFQKIRSEKKGFINSWFG